MPSPAWPMLLHDPRHTGCAAGFGPATFTAGWTASSLGVISGVALDAAGRVLVASASGTVKCLDPNGTQAWTTTIPAGVAPGPPAIGASGRIYIANGDVFALDPATGAQVWEYARAGTYTIVTAALTVGADETVYALTSTSTSGQPNQLLAITAGARKWELTLPYRSSSSPAIASDGTLYIGCEDGILRALAPDGGVRWTWSANGKLPGPPSVGADGTVYVGVQAPLTADNALVALTPPATLGQNPTVRWSYSPSPGEYLGAFGGLAIAPDGTLYVGFDALHAVRPDGTKRWSTPITDAERSPGPVAVGIDGSVYFVSAAGTLWAYDAAGAELWSSSIGVAGQPSAPALGPSGAIYVGDGQGTLRSSVAAPPLNARLTAIYSRLQAARTATGTGGQWSYPLSSSSIADAPVLALVQAALGAQEGSLTTDATGLHTSAGTLVLSGSGAFLGGNATINLTFAPAGDEISLEFSATLTIASTLAQLLSKLRETLFEQCTFAAGARFTQSSSTSGPTPAGWQLTAATDPYAQDSPLAESARMLALPTGPQTVKGAVTPGAPPLVSLQVGTSQKLPLGDFTGMEASLWLETAPSQMVTGALLASVTLRSTLTIAGEAYALRAEAPREAGVSTFTATRASPQRVGLTDLALWGGGAQTLPEIVPASMRGPSETFGLEQVEVGFLTSNAVLWIGFTLSAPDWQALSAAGVGVDLSIRGITLEIVCARPFDEPTLSATLAGKILSTIHTQSGSSAAEFAVAATAPDFQIYGSLVEGTQVRLQDVLTAMSGSDVTLPAGVPAPVVEEIELYAQPWAGTFALDLAGNLNWTLFQIQGSTFGLGEFGISVQRLQALPDGSRPAIAAYLSGRLLLGGVAFDVIGDSPAGSDGWDLRANLVSPVAFPSIGAIVETFSQAWAQSLPAEVKNAGQQINLKELTVGVDQAPSTHRSLAATIGTLPSWSGWTVLSSPVEIKLTAVDVQLLADSAGGLSGSMRGAVAIGSGKVAVAIAMPWASGSFTVSYTAGNDGLTLPSIGDLRSWLVPTLPLPDDVAAMGGLDLQTFSLSAVVASAQTTIDLSASALDASHKWVIVPGEPGRRQGLGVQNLTVKAHRDATESSGAIGATLVLGGGSLPLKASMQRSWSTYTIGLDTSAPAFTPPSVASIVELVSPALLGVLPEGLKTLAANIAITRFQVAVEDAGTTFDAALGAIDQTVEWHPIAILPRFRLQALALSVTASTNPSVVPGGAIRGTILIGANGRIPLQTTLDVSAGEISLARNPNGGAATMPTLGDLAELVSPAWKDALPSALAGLGSSLELAKFALSATPSTSAWLVEVQVATTSGWSGYEPISGFKALKFTSASASLTSGSATSTVGTLACAAEVLGRHVTFTLTLPEGVFATSLTTGLTLEALAGYILGTTAPLPSWLQHLGLPEIVAEANFRESLYTLAAVLGEDIPLGAAGKLKSLRLEAQAGGTGGPKVCLKGVWVTAGAVEVPGSICYPFEIFEGIGESPIRNFPPEGPPDVQPLTQSELNTTVENLLAQDATAGAAASISYYGYGAGAVATGVALLSAGVGLGVAAKALADTWQLNALALAEKLSSVAAERHTAISATEMASAIAAAYPSGIATAAMADALACTYTLSALELVGALKAAPYSPRGIAPVVKSRYAQLDAAAMIAALEQGWRPDTISAGDMIGALAGAGYDPLTTAAPFHTAYAVETATGAQFAMLCAGAGFTPALIPQTLANAMATAAYGASDTLAGLRAAFPQQVQSASQAVPFLHGAGYSAAQVVAALAIEVPQATSMASLLSQAGYSAAQAAPALVLAYASQLPDAQALLRLLCAGWNDLTLAQAAAALAATTFTPQQVTLALRANESFHPQLATASQTAAVLHGAYAATLTLPAMLLALAAAEFPAYASAPAAVAQYTTPAPSVATALLASYPTLSALTLAASLAAAAYASNDISTGILVAAPSTPAGALGAIVAAVGSDAFAATLKGASDARVGGEDAAAAAQQLVRSTPNLIPDVLAAAIDAAYAPGAPVLSALANAIVPAYATPDGKALAGALLIAEPLATPSALAVALAAGLTVAHAAVAPNDIAADLVAAYTHIGAQTSETPVAQALVAVFAGHTPGLTALLAAALAHAFPTTTPAASLAALAAALTGTPALPGMTVAAVAQALAIPSGQPLALAQALANTYELNYCPVAVGASALAMMLGGFELTKVSSAFKQTLRGWTADDYGTLLNVYQNSAQWMAAWTAASAGQAAPDTVRTLNTQFKPGAPRLVQVVVAAYELIDPLAAANAIATGFKRIAISESDALAALRAFFASFWTAAATQAVQSIYATTTTNREESR